LLRLQGFPEDFKIVVPYSAIRKQTGNSVAVPVIAAVARQMKKAIDEYERGYTSWQEESELVESEPRQLSII
jgi:DNA (cytosine-5)-methyltransferase 1